MKASKLLEAFFIKIFNCKVLNICLNFAYQHTFGYYMSQKVLLNAKEVNIILHRLACQLIENHNDFTNTVLIGIQPRGKFLANRLVKVLRDDYKIKNVLVGHLDITFYRDDFRRGEKSLEANTTEIDFIVEEHDAWIRRKWEDNDAFQVSYYTEKFFILLSLYYDGDTVVSVGRPI